MGLKEPEVYSEQGSAYKLEKVRPIWEKVVQIAKKEKRDIIVWRYYVILYTESDKLIKS